MDMMSVLWQVGIFASVLVFGVKIGLASGLANLSKKLFAIICIAYGGGVVLISAIASLLIIAGLFTIREWKIHDKNTSTATSLAIIAPCPCCFGSIIASVLIVAPTIGVSSLNLSWYAAAALVAVMVVTYLASNTIVRFIRKPYPIVLGNFMLLLGAYFLLSAIVIPNIAGALTKTVSPISISSPQDILMVILAFAILIVGGMVLTKRGRSLLE